MAGVAQISRAESRARRGLLDDTPALDAEPLEVVDAEASRRRTRDGGYRDRKRAGTARTARRTRPRIGTGYGPGTAPADGIDPRGSGRRDARLGGRELLNRRRRRGRHPG